MLRLLFTIIGNLVAAVAGAGLLARFVPPDVWWPPAIIALALPVLLVLNACFVGFCLYQRRYKTAIFPVLVLLIALPLTFRLFAFGSGLDDGKTPTVSLLTSNVRGFKDGAHVAIEKTTALAYLKRYRPDVLLIQESHHDRSTSPYFKDIKSITGLERRHQPKGKTLSTYANRPTFIADKFTGYNGYLITDVKTDLGTLRIINVHLASNRITGMAGQIGQDGDVKKEIKRAESMLRSYGAAAATRTQQADEIRKYISDSPYPVIVAGDFNDVPSSYTYQRLLTPRLKDAWVEGGFGLGTTFTGPLPGLRIDFVLADTSLNVHSIERVDTGFSDHLGLSVQFTQ